MIIRSVTVAVSLVCALLVCAACDLFNPERPTAQPDQILYGNLLDVGAVAEDGGTRVVRMQVGVPRSLAQAEVEDGKPAPVVESGLTAEVTVTADSVVLVGGRPGSLDDLNPGTEVVALPVPGTTRMIGATRILAEAESMLDFVTYQQWKLPRLGVPDEPPGDPSRINSPGIEHAPVPAAGGRVLYFAGRLCRPATPEGPWVGALRPGMSMPEGGASAVERTYRTEMTESGWSEPREVVFPGLGDAESVRVSWVSKDETRCLVTVNQGAATSWVGAAARSSARVAWGDVERVEALGNGDASDAVYLAGSMTKMTFVSRRGVGVQSDLHLHDPKVPGSPLPLEPRINTAGDEWGARIGPQGELFFMRQDRQLVLAGGSIHPVRLPGPHRVLLTEAAPTRDGQWVFFCMPRYRPSELGLDLYVAPWIETGLLGPAVPVDDWRPQ